MGNNLRCFFGMIFCLFIGAAVYGCSFSGSGKPRSVEKERINLPFTRQGEVVILDGEGVDTLYRGEIEIADDFNKTAQGLMYRDSMEDAQGMLFIFGREEPLSFWMKNTRISLDIVYISSAGKIVSIQKNAKPYCLDALPSDAAAQYVLELNGGLCDSLGLQAGNTVQWKRDSNGLK